MHRTPETHQLLRFFERANIQQGKNINDDKTKNEPGWIQLREKSRKLTESEFTRKNNKYKAGNKKSNRNDFL